MNRKPYYDYHTYLKKHFGAVTYKVSVDAGFTCPNIDGTLAKGGCTYCNNRSFIPPYLKRSESLLQQIEQGVSSQRRRYGAERFLAYFQAYTNTYDHVDRLRERYRRALDHPDIDGLVIGTRADCLPEEVVSLLEEIARSHYVALEIGIESVCDETLLRINRGHTYAVVEDAFRRIAGRGIHLGAHLILGFPGEDRAHWLETARVVSELPMEYLKIHHLQVVRGTALAEEYQSHPFPLPGFDEWVGLASDFLEHLDPGIAIARLCGSAPLHLLIAPRWGRKKHPEVISGVMETLVTRGSRQGSRRQGNDGPLTG